MAVRFRKGRASPWQCYWNNPVTGKRESESFATELEAEKHDSLIKHRIRFDRESFLQEIETQEDGSDDVLTFEMCYLEYLKQKQFNKKGLTWQLDSMRLPLEQWGNLAIDEIRREDIISLMNSCLNQRNIKPVTVRGRFSVLRTVLRWCAAQGYCEAIEFPQLPAARYEKFIPPTHEEISAILQHAAPHIVRVIILGAQCGVRVGPSELFQLTWADVDMNRRLIRIHGSQKNANAPWREVPIRESLIHIFEQWKAEDRQVGSIHLINCQGKPVKSIKTAWSNALERAGITRRIRPYDLRHAFATEAIAAGVDIGTVASLMGHSNPNMILNHYQYVMDGQKRAAVESLPDVSICAQGYVPKKRKDSPALVSP